MDPYYADDAVTLYHGDCRAVMLTLDEASIDSIISDPPYELGFMGKSWDSTGIAYDAEMWSECLRILKPGGYLLSFGGSRTYHRMACAVEDAGFQLRDPIAWIFGSGFPKAKTVLKPAFEPITCARRPFKGSESANVQEYGTGALNIEACRIDASGPVQASAGGWQPPTVRGGDRYVKGTGRLYTDLGRWPPNVILDESQAAELDRQTGSRRSSGVYTGDASRRPGEHSTNFVGGNRPSSMYDDEGGASRFFPVFKYQAKAPASERPRDGEIAHPTVKPLDLMRWLVRLVTPPGGTVVDPFAGSGTTAEACVIDGFNCIAIEREADYLPLITARLKKPIQGALDFAPTLAGPYTEETE